MGKLIVIAIFAIMAIMALVRPRAGAVFTWFAIWLYPVSLMYGMLPLNLRLDDLWVIYIFLAALLLAGNGRRPRVGRAAMISLLWFLVAIAGNMTGFLLLGAGFWREILKVVGKALYVPCTAITLSLLLDDEAALKSHGKWLVLGAIAAGLLGVIMVYLPGPFGMFMIPKDRFNLNALEIVEMKSEIERRAAGAIGTPALAQVTLYIGLLALCMALQRFSRRTRALYGLAAASCLMAMGFTASRGCAIALIAVLLYALLFTQRKTALLSYLALGSPAILLLSGVLVDRLLLRVSGEAGGFSRFWEAWEIRNRIVLAFLENFNPLYLLTGMGMTATQSLGLGTTHNTYIGSFVYGGIPGLVLLLVIITTAWKSGSRLLHIGRDALSQALGIWLHMLVLAACVYGFAAENFQTVVPMQLLFAGMVFVEKRQMQVDSALRGMLNTQGQARWSLRGRWRLVTRGAGNIGRSRIREVSEATMRRLSFCSSRRTLIIQKEHKDTRKLEHKPRPTIGCGPVSNPATAQAVVSIPGRAVPQNGASRVK